MIFSLVSSLSLKSSSKVLLSILMFFIRSWTLRQLAISIFFPGFAIPNSQPFGPLKIPNSLLLHLNSISRPDLLPSYGNRIQSSYPGLYTRLQSRFSLGFHHQKWFLGIPVPSRTINPVMPVGKCVRIWRIVVIVIDIHICITVAVIVSSLL
jgi:hypothetical protein